MAICDRCTAEIATGEGYAVYSTSPIFLDSGGKEIGAMLFCDKCANDLFTEHVWKEAKDLTERERREITRITELAEPDIAGRLNALTLLTQKMHNFSIAMGAKRRGVGPDEARQEAREISQLWWKDRKAAENRLLQNVRGKKRWQFWK